MSELVPTEQTEETLVRIGRPPHEYVEGVVDILETTPSPGTVTQMCETLGVSTRVFYRWMKEQPDFSEAVMRVRARADDVAENALYKRALGYTKTLNEQRVDKDGCKHDLERDVHIPADVGALTMWLKNRRPKEWRDKVEIEMKGNFFDMVEQRARELYPHILEGTAVEIEDADGS